MRKLWSENHELATTSQNIAELWNVSTRPASARGGFGLAVSVVEARVKVIEKLGAILPFSMAAYDEWRRKQPATTFDDLHQTGARRT